MTTAVASLNLAVNGTILPDFASAHPVLRLIFVLWPIALAPALFTWLLPALFGYQRGLVARVAVLLALVCSVALGLALVSPATLHAYECLQPWLYGIFYLYAVAGLALCVVGLRDHKRSAVWATLAVLSLIAGGLSYTLGWAEGSSAVAWGFIGFAGFLLIGFLLRQADPVGVADVRESTAANNRTRRARSLTRKLLREGRVHWVPIYYVAALSDMAREGILRSGSYRFADHIYRMEPSGITPLGRWLDGIFLHLPATMAFHLRYKQAQVEMRRAFESLRTQPGPLRMLALPCGLPRDLTELCATLKAEDPALLARLEYCGMDIDPELLQLADAFTRDCGVPQRTFHQGNALKAETYPAGKFHGVVSTGLGEFLQTPELEVFYRNVFDALAPGGTFYTSATRYEKRSEAFLQAFELITQYRTTEQLEAILSKLPWTHLKLTQDNSGLQTFVVAVK